MILWDEEYNLPVADCVEEARGIAHASGPRFVGVEQDEGLCVYRVTVDGCELAYAPDHWGLPAWYAEEV